MLPKNLKYGSKVESAPARSSRTNISPQNGMTYSALGDQIIINIPTRNNLVLVPSESYLKFDFSFTNPANSAARWDSCGAHGLIQRIRVYSGSNLIEDIDNYNLLAKMLFDLQMPTDSTYGKHNILSGTRSDTVIGARGAAAATAGTLTAAEISSALFNGTLNSYQVNSGDILGPANAATTSSYALNLISVMGALCSDRYFPLFACTSAPIRIEIQLVDSLVKAMALTTTTGAAFTMSNVEYVANFIELSDVAMGMIQQSLEGNPLQFVIPQWRNFASSQWTLTNTSTTITIPVAAKFSSLKSLFATVRDKGLGAATFMPFSSVSLNIANYQWRVGPNVMPPKPPAALPEMFAEAVKAIASLSDLQHQPSIDKSSYVLTLTPAGNFTNDPLFTNVQSGSFYVGLDLENYSNAPKDSIFAGYNSNTDDIYLQIQYNAQTNNVTPRFDIYACFDCVYVFENNTCYIKF